MIERSRFGWLGCILILVLAAGARAEEDDIVLDTVEPDLGSSREGSRTDSEVYMYCISREGSRRDSGAYMYCISREGSRTDK